MRFLLSKLRIFLFFPIPYLSQPHRLRQFTQRLIELSLIKAAAL